MTVRIDAARLAGELDALAAFSAVPAPAVTRVVFSAEDMRAREYVASLCAEAGFAVREDAVGNTFARLAGTDADAAAVATGSHIDAIPNAGRFDGTVGVLGGLAAMRAIAESGLRPRRSLELVLFTSEEPTRFGIGCLGSRLMSGTLNPSAGTRLTGSDGATLNDARTAAGFTGDLASVRLGSSAYQAFVELHIEQGPLLEREGLDVGVVTAIAAPAGWRMTIEGEGGHAGAMLMPARHDAFLAAAEIALALERAVLASGAIDTVGTVGVCDVFPGAVNSVPSRARIEIDVRDIDLARRDAVLDRLAADCDGIARRRGVTVTREVVNADPPAVCAPPVVDALVQAASARGLRWQRMVSRAYHDSLFMSRIAPTAMLFIPCRGGVSHRPDEYASPHAIAQGAEVLADALVSLSA